MVARRLAIVPFLVLIAGTSFAARLLGQNRTGRVAPLSGGGPTPVVTLVAPTTSVVYESNPLIKFDFCDDSTLDAETRVISLNDNGVTSSFNYVSAPLVCGLAHKTSSSTSVTLNPGSNSLYAQICDNSGHCGSRTSPITYSAPPTITLVVPAANGENGRAIVRSRRPVVRATYSAATPLDSTSVVLKIRGVDVTSLTRHNRSILEWEVDSAHELSPGDTADIPSLQSQMVLSRILGTVGEQGSTS